MEASTILKSLDEFRGRKELERYDEAVCNDIKKRIDTKLRESKVSVADRAKFARKNLQVMDKWQQVFPHGISQCLNEYFSLRMHSSPSFDPRFPNQNQSRNCFINYVDYHRCAHKRGEDDYACKYFKNAYQVLCPVAWVEKWDDQRSNNAFQIDVTK